jgi:hypothetical protein
LLPDFFLETFTSRFLVTLKRCSRKLAREASEIKLSNRMPTIIIKISLLPSKAKSNLSYILRFSPYVTENSVCFSQRYQSKILYREECLFPSRIINST